MGQIDPQLTDILVCPRCRTRVEECPDTVRCTNPACALVYPIRDGIPIMLIEQAVSPEE